ncbi:TIGR03943 family putative permease subunit [Clostridium sp. Marseille-Q7071]
MKKFNLNEVIWFLILLSFSLSLSNLIYTKRIFSFIHPNMVKYMYFVLASLIILDLFQFKKIFTIEKREKIKYSYILFVILLISIPLVKTDTINSSMANLKGYKYFKSNNSEYSSFNSLQNIDLKEKIEIDEKNFMKTFEEIVNNLDYYEGKKIVVEGFVYKNTSFENQQFLLSRPVMNCCAADAEIYGILCEYDKADKLQKDSWVRVEATIHNIISKYDREVFNSPLLKVILIEQVKKPIVEYVYPK